VDSVFYARFNGYVPGGITIDFCHYLTALLILYCSVTVLFSLLFCTARYNIVFGQDTFNVTFCRPSAPVYNIHDLNVAWDPLLDFRNVIHNTRKSQ
jgi:hypothetical protein